MKITKRQLRKIIREAVINETLPPHLKKHFNKDGSAKVHNPMGYTIKDVTPPGYGPDDGGSYDNIEAMNKAVMDAIFKDPVREDELIRVAKLAAPSADDNEVLDFIDELLDQGTIEFDETTGMYDLP